MIPAAMINPAGSPFINSTAKRVPIMTPNNTVGLVDKTPTPFPTNVGYKETCDNRSYSCRRNKES